jgi:LuxR family maltose regulon positive regulatory protein
MATPILATKLYMPPPRPDAVPRPRLAARLNEGLGRRLALISAPAGFGKTTLVSAWLAASAQPVAWLSLDAGENDPARFLAYLVASLQTLAPQVGAGVLSLLQSPQPPATEALLTILLNDLARIADPTALVLDDYHVIEAQAVDAMLAFLLDHLPPHLHLVIATRADPDLPLARLRAAGYLTELRVADLRFTPDEAAAFLTGVMGLRLTAQDIATLDARTEGWIAGLQLAALSLQGHLDASQFISTFTGSHRFVLDYLAEEVLQKQPEHLQTFLLRTSILDRLCGALCDAVLLDPAAPGQATLEQLEHANLFLVPLDDERRWYRYHHLFADLLRQRLGQRAARAADAGSGVATLHLRASAWFEEQGLILEAFQHAAAAGDTDRAVRLISGRGIPLHYRGAVTAILDWLGSLPAAELEARPALLARYAGLMLVNGQSAGVAEKLDAAEAAMRRKAPDDTTADLVGQIATARATLALGWSNVGTIIAEARRALDHLRPTNVPFRMTAHWTLGYAYLQRGDRAAARQAYAAALALSQAGGATFFTLMATAGLGAVQEAETQLHRAAETYRHVLDLAGEQPLPVAHEAHLGLARIHYEWNELEAAERHGHVAVHLARQIESAIDRFVPCEVFLARLKLAQGDAAGAAALLAELNQEVRQRHFDARLPEVAAVQVPALLRLGRLAAAARLAQTYQLPLSQARVHLAAGDAAAALAVLGAWGERVAAQGWDDERLRVLVLQAVALDARGARDHALRTLGEALALAAAGGYIRLFVDEGAPMVRLLRAAAARDMLPDDVARLLAACAAVPDVRNAGPTPPSGPPLIEPLSPREREVLRLIAQGLSNLEISDRLVITLETVKGHNKRIFGKLQVKRRTEAVARARELGLL